MSDFTAALTSSKVLLKQRYCGYRGNRKGLSRSKMCVSERSVPPFVLFSAKCKAVITCNEAVRGGRPIPLKATVDAAVKSCPTVRHVFVSQRTEKPCTMGEVDVPLEEVSGDTWSWGLLLSS